MSTGVDGKAVNMAYQIFRIEKVKRQGVGGCQSEHNRTEADRGRFPDSNINYDVTHKNAYLKKSRNYWQDVQKILGQAGITKYRKDAVVMLDAIYTASPEAMASMSEAERQAYFMDCCEWHESHFGPIINAVIHYDETTIHMHVDSVPVMQKEDGTWKLSAKELIGNRAQMSALQTDLHAKVSKHYNLERGESRTPDEQRKHLTKLEHEIKVLKSEKLQLQSEKIELEDKIEDSCEEVEKVNATLTDILQKLGENVPLPPVRTFQQKETKNANATLDELNTTMSLITRISSATRRFAEEILKEYAPRFRNAYQALQPVLEHFFATETKTYLEIKERMDKPMELGQKAIKNFKEGNLNYKDAEILKSAVKELETIVDEYEDDWER